VNFSITDHDLEAFVLYARRESSLDQSLRAAEALGEGEEHKRSLNALREINKWKLFQSTRYGEDR
jgi:hypothetical protein